MSLPALSAAYPVSSPAFSGLRRRKEAAPAVPPQPEAPQEGAHRLSRRGFLAGVAALGGTVALSQTNFFSWLESLWGHGEIIPASVPPNVFGAPQDTFCFLGDFGRGVGDEGGPDAVRDMAQRMFEEYQKGGYNAIFTVGDNIYPNGDILQHAAEKFEKPFAKLLGTDAKFYACLGNHDTLDGFEGDQMNYEPWNMNGQAYYKKSIAGGQVDVFVIDSNDYIGKHHFSLPLEPEQRIKALQQTRWLDAEMRASTAKWKIVASHVPLYHSAMRLDLDRDRMQFYKGMIIPIMEKYGATFVSGHEHGYENFPPINGVKQIITGGGGAPIREFNHPTENRPDARLMQNQFLKCVVDGDELKFVSINRNGDVIDGGTIPPAKAADKVSGVTVDNVWAQVKDVPAFA